MLFIKENEKQEISQKIKEMPQILRNPNVIIFIFEGLGTLVLAYGIAVSQYLHPISRHEPNPYWTFLISCFLYLAISIAAPFTGGHINPSVTIGLMTAGLGNKSKIGWYILSQLCGALLGVFICNDIS